MDFPTTTLSSVYKTLLPTQVAKTPNLVVLNTVIIKETKTCLCLYFNRTNTLCDLLNQDPQGY